MDAFEYLFSLEKLGIKFGLENIRAISGALGNPHEAFRSILVAGTNGKGSVTAMTERALRAAGYRVGRYTSPHLVRLEERFVVDGAPVATGELRAVVDDVRGVVERLVRSGGLPVQPTFFEVTTAAAFELFRRRGIELAVLEVGMGGRFDATNIVSSLAVAITSIDLDHEKFLGHTIAEIAFEKTGVIKSGGTVVVGERKPEPLGVIAQACRERGATLVEAWDGVVTDVTVIDGRTRLSLRTPRRAYGPLTLALRGRHQVANAMVAVRLVEALEALESVGTAVGADAIRTGLADAQWRGRLDLVAAGPDRTLLVDAAHNPAGAAALAAYLGECYPSGLPIVFGAMRDKNAAEMLAALAPAATRFVLTKPANPRASAPDDLAALARHVAPSVPVETCDEAWTAVDRALDSAPLACVAGSIFLVGEVLAALDHGQRL